MDSCSLNGNDCLDWEVREIDLKENCLEDILKYLKNHCLKYYWMDFFHDGSVECEIIDETVPTLRYHHLFEKRYANKFKKGLFQ